MYSQHKGLDIYKNEYRKLKEDLQEQLNNLTFLRTLPINTMDKNMETLNNNILQLKENLKLITSFYNNVLELRTLHLIGIPEETITKELIQIKEKTKENAKWRPSLTSAVECMVNELDLIDLTPEEIAKQKSENDKLKYILKYGNDYEKYMPSTSTSTSSDIIPIPEIKKNEEDEYKLFQEFLEWKKLQQKSKQLAITDQPSSNLNPEPNKEQPKDTYMFQVTSSEEEKIIDNKAIPLQSDNSDSSDKEFSTYLNNTDSEKESELENKFLKQLDIKANTTQIPPPTQTSNEPSTSSNPRPGPVRFERPYFTDRDTARGNATKVEPDEKEEWVRKVYVKPRYNVDSHMYIHNKYEPIIKQPVGINPLGSYLDIDCALNRQEIIDQWVTEMTKVLKSSQVDGDKVQFVLAAMRGIAREWFVGQHTLIRALKTLIPDQIMTTIHRALYYNFLGKTYLEEDEDEIKGRRAENLWKIEALQICQLKEIDKFNCAFEDYFYKARLNDRSSLEYRQYLSLYFSKLPAPYNKLIWENYLQTYKDRLDDDTLAQRMMYAKQWIDYKCRELAIQSVIKKDYRKQKLALGCKENELVPKFGCKDDYYKNKRKKKKYFKQYKKPYKPYKKFLWKKEKKNKFRKHKRYFAKKKEYKPNKKPYKCKCFTCGKEGHISPNCPDKGKNIKQTKFIEIIEENFELIPYEINTIESDIELFYIENYDDLQNEFESELSSNESTNGESSNG